VLVVIKAERRAVTVYRCVILYEIPETQKSLDGWLVQRFRKQYLVSVMVVFIRCELCLSRAFAGNMDTQKTKYNTRRTMVCYVHRRLHYRRIQKPLLAIQRSTGLPQHSTGWYIEHDGRQKTMDTEEHRWCIISQQVICHPLGFPATWVRPLACVMAIEASIAARNDVCLRTS